jgi:hypothetical protein
VRLLREFAGIDFEDRLVLHLAPLAQIVAVGRVADDEIGGTPQIGDDGWAHGAGHALVLDLDVGATAGLLAVQVGPNVRDSPIPTKYWHRPRTHYPRKLIWGVITGALISPANAAATADPSALLQQNLIRHLSVKPDNAAVIPTAWKITSAPRAATAAANSVRMRAGLDGHWIGRDRRGPARRHYVADG